MPEPTPSPHDALFRRVFSEPEHAAAELRHVLPAGLVEAIDWTSLEVQPGTWIDDELRASHADLLCSVQLAEQPALVYFLLEHKSGNDPFTALQLLVYIVRIWQSWRREHPQAKKLPPIVPVVVHHGASGWRGPRSLHPLVDIPPELAATISPFVPDFSFALDDLATASEDALHARTMSALARLTLFCLKRARESGDLLAELHRWGQAMHTVAAAENGADALAALLSYIMQVADLAQDEFQRFLTVTVGPEARNTAMTNLADRMRDEMREEMRAEDRAEILIEQLTERFGELPAEVTARIRSATADGLRTWLRRVVSAPSLEDVLRD